jgi:DNA-binding IclR family transcriptional regulator
MLKLSELEKSILLAFLALTKATAGKFLRKDEIIFKYTRRQRRNVERAIEKLTKEKFLEKFPREERYALTEKGLKTASSLLIEGSKFWKIR